MDKRWHVGVLGLGRLPIGWRLVIAFGGINLLVFTMMAVTVLSLGQAEQALAARFQIRSIPTLALFWQGREIARQPGAMGQADIVRWARAALARPR